MRGQRPTEGRVSRATLVAGVAIAILVLCLLTARWLWSSAASFSPPAADDPNALKLLYVRPDYGPEVYDAAGKFLERIPTKTIRVHWEEDQLAREILFKCRVEGDNPLFGPMAKLAINGGASRSNAWLRCTESTGPWHTLLCGPILPKTIRRPPFLLGPIRLPRSQTPVRTIDVEIRCFAGPRGSAKATFAGPFKAGQTYRAEENPSMILEGSAHGGAGMKLHFVGPPPMDSEAPIILYLRDGQRLFAEGRGGSTSSSRGFDWTCIDLHRSLADIAHITIDETPQKQVFRNIVVAYPDRPDRTYPQSFDEIATRLDLDVDLTGPEAIDEFAYHRSFLNSPSEALQILDIAQGRHLDYAMDTLKKGSIQDLSESEQKQLESILNTWLESGREIEACHLGLWAQWPQFIDRIASMLQSGDLTQQPLRQLASEWARKAPPSPEIIKTMTDLLIDRDIADIHVCLALIRAVRQNAQDDGHCVQKLAECEKPWIWEQVIRADSRFRRWKEDRQLSQTVEARMVALGMDDWIDDPQRYKARAKDILCSMLTPQYVELGDMHRWLRQFEKQVPPERGTEVLARYLKAQLEQWHTWDLPGRASRSPTGVRMAVQLLNRWHDINLGALGQDSQRYVDDYRFNWQDIIQEALYWARTGREPRMLPSDWRPSQDDLRVVWYNKTSPEMSVIALWPAHQDPNLPPIDVVMEVVEDFLQFSITRKAHTTESSRVYDVCLRAGVRQRRSIGPTLTFKHEELPKAIDPGPTHGTGVGRDGVRHPIPVWNGSWEIWVESATASESVIKDTDLFRTWQEQYLSDSPAPTDRVFQRTTKEAQLQYIFDRRDYSGMTEAEIALRQAMDWDPQLSSDELKDYKGQMSRQDAVEKYRQLLKRADLPIEAQIFVWSRIADLSRPRTGVDGDDPADDWEAAQYAFERAISLDPNWVSPTTIQLQFQRGTFAEQPADHTKHLLDPYEWLLTRTPAMIEASVRRPVIDRSHTRPQSMHAGASEDNVEREKSRLIRQLSQRIQSTHDMISLGSRRSGNALDRHRDRWERLCAMDEQHWSHTYGDSNAASGR